MLSTNIAKKMWKKNWEWHTMGEWGARVNSSHDWVEQKYYDVLIFRICWLYSTTQIKNTIPCANIIIHTYCERNFYPIHELDKMGLWCKRVLIFPKQVNQLFIIHLNRYRFWIENRKSNTWLFVRWTVVDERHIGQRSGLRSLIKFEWMWLKKTEMVRYKFKFDYYFHSTSDI